MGAVGVVLGGALGVALVAYFTANPIFAIDDFAVRPHLAAATLWIPAGVVFAATLLGAVAPAIAAARLEPHETLRSVP